MQFQTNKVGLDEVTLQLTTTGSDQASTNLKVPLLDEKLEYSFCVDSLNVPLNFAPINKLKGSELFRIERRNQGATTAGDLGFQVAPLVTVETGVFTVTRDYYDVASLVSSLNNFARGFEIHMSLLGISTRIGSHFGAAQAVTEAVIIDPLFNPAAIAPLVILPPLDEAGLLAEGPYKMLSFKLATDGSLEIFGTANFWNNFVINFRLEGAEALGFSSNVKGLDHGAVFGVPVKVPQVSYYLGFTELAGGIVTNEFTVGAASALLAHAGAGVPPTHFAAGNMSASNSVFSEHSLFQCLDQRLKITVESHMPTMSNVLILNEKESVDRSIAEVYFLKNTKSSLTFDEDGNFESNSLEVNTYSGDYPLIKKSSPWKQWTKLTTAYEQRFFRFHLFMWYRKFNRVTEVWEIKKEKLQIPEKRSWEMLLRFVSSV